MAKIIHQVEKCIGCGICTVAAPDHFEMGEDGKAHLKDSEEVKEKQDSKESTNSSRPPQAANEVKEVEVTDSLKKAANSCPVQCIKIKE